MRSHKKKSYVGEFFCIAVSTNQIPIWQNFLSMISEELIAWIKKLLRVKAFNS